MSATHCPDCKGKNLQISYPAWFKFEDTDGPLDATTLVDVDSEASATVYCEDCNETFSGKVIYNEQHVWPARADLPAAVNH